jgi:AbrB family looped-hinge helix DNA binding protein
MALVKLLRAGQVTLPAEMRKALALAAGDYLEVELVGRSVVLRPLRAADRAKAWAELRRIIDTPKRRPDAPPMTPEQEEQMIFEEVEAFRHGR